ncbi:hypothetical protein TorRG33x02_128980 [Trema orientale]|uniref:Uncharacterized protein n=1 Tax=Trema orientale TaxID=63057 RepID=A0A2P5F0N8_TREOI|nr:hypothetical protein TorRG33x02_128980 [Trema orientale]
MPFSSISFSLTYPEILKQQGPDPNSRVSLSHSLSLALPHPLSLFQIRVWLSLSRAPSVSFCVSDRVVFNIGFCLYYTGASIPPFSRSFALCFPSSPLGGNLGRKSPSRTLFPVTRSPTPSSVVVSPVPQSLSRSGDCLFYRSLTLPYCGPFFCL